MMRRNGWGTTIQVGVFVATLQVAGCGGDGVRAAKIANEIVQAPEDADAILEAHAMTWDEWEDLLFEVAADPVQAEKYQAKFRGTE